MLKKILIICLVFILSGCSLFADKRVIIKPEPKPISDIQRWIDTRNKWMSLARLCEKYFDTTGWTTEEIATELYLQNYLLFSKPQNQMSKN